MNYYMDYKKAQEIGQSNLIIKQGELREAIYDYRGDQMCKICRNHNSGHFNEVGLHLCVPCADLVANIYSHMVTGNFATWDIDVVEKPRYSSKRKDVITQTLRTQVFERDKYRCVNCGTYKDLSIDHIHPESRGGKTTLENLQTLCRSCNSQKGTKTMDEWLGV